MNGIAVSSALFAADDVSKAAALMKEKVRELL